MSREHIFFFNDCIPTEICKHTFLEKFTATIAEFNELLKFDLNIGRGIVTHRQPSECEYGSGYNLQEIINLIEDKTTKDLAYSLFLRFPVGKPYFEDEFEELFAKTYKIIINQESFNALNLAIVHMNAGFLLSPAVHEDLEVDCVKVFYDDDQVMHLPNLFGDQLNTEVIRNILVKRGHDNLEIFDLFLTLFNNPVYSKQFKKDFDNLSEISKELVISHFKEAKNRIMPTDFSADGDLIKDVTPEKNKCNVFELRVRKNKELRVYFSEVNNRMFLASIGFKNNNQQDQDIKHAHIALYKLILTN